MTRWYTRFILKRTAGVIVLGECLRYLFEPYFKPEQIFVVPNGADFTFPTVEKQEKLQLLYLANFLPTKGFDIFLDALVSADFSAENLEVNAYGAWDNEAYERKCKDIIEANQLPVNIHPPVSGEEKLKAFKSADLFVFIPQAPEGHPWVIVEAMAAGLPIITTDQGAIKESVLDGQNGFIVPVADVAATAAKLEDLLRDEGLRKSFGEASRNHYKANFTEEQMVGKLAEVFRKVIG